MFRPAIVATVVAALLQVSAPATPALADGAIVELLTEADEAILDQIDSSRAAAVARANTSPVEADRRTLAQVLAGEALPFDPGYDPGGRWRCRFLKLGGNPVLTVYGWFQCRIFDDGAGWVLHKPTGSQRSQGRLYDWSEGRLLYLGAQYFDNEAPIMFGDNPERNHMAVLTRLADGRLRLEFPAPLAESDFDILELVR